MLLSFKCGLFTLVENLRKNLWRNALKTDVDFHFNFLKRWEGFSVGETLRTERSSRFSERERESLTKRGGGHERA